MGADVFKRRGAGGRAGGWALSTLGTPLNALVLKGLADGPSSLAALQGRGGSPGSTLRARLKELVDADVIAVRRSTGFPGGSAIYELTGAGEDLLVVTEILERWLEGAPSMGRPLGSASAKGAVKALVGGWSAALLRALAARPHSIAELDSLIGDLNYPSLERRIAAMRLAGQVEARPANGRETPYAVTDWLRRGAAPLLAGIRWERSHLPGGSMVPTTIDVEALFLLAMPLLRLEDDLRGSCRLSVELPNGRRPRLAGVLTGLHAGELASCTSRLDGGVDAWASGSVGAWLTALIDADLVPLELGGDGHLAREVIDGLHRALFGHAEKSRERVRSLAG